MGGRLYRGRNVVSFSAELAEVLVDKSRDRHWHFVQAFYRVVHGDCAISFAHCFCCFS
jgi:hypothetical protein